MNNWRLPMHVVVVFGVMATLLVGCAPLVLGGQDEEEANATPLPTPPGATVFATYCASCHGSEGRGGSAPAIKPSALSRQQLFEIIADGRSGTSMPGFRGRISEAEVSAVISYVLGQ